MLLQRSVSLAISHSQVAFYKVDTAEGVKVNLEQLLLAILPLIIINFFPPSFSYHVWCYPFICGEDVFIVIYSSTLNISLLPFDFRQEFLEICRIYMRLWKRHKWWFKLRQCGCKKNWLRMSNVLNMLFSELIVLLNSIMLSFCIAELSLMVIVRVSWLRYVNFSPYQKVPPTLVLGTSFAHFTLREIIKCVLNFYFLNLLDHVDIILNQCREHWNHCSVEWPFTLSISMSRRMLL